MATSSPFGSPRSRAQRQRETREALILAALDAFSRDGYHSTSLEGIANRAGFSKGAIYSNFTGKPDLFLTLMEFNFEMLRDGDWDPFAADDPMRVGEEPPKADGGLGAAEMMRGFGLATLEFIATAARDEKLVPALRERMQMMIDAYTRVATHARPADENLPSADVALLMTALDQGTTMLALSGITSLDPAVVRVGLRRIIDPRSAAADPEPQREGSASFPGVEQVQRLLEGDPRS